MCVKFEVSIRYISGVFDINTAKREQIWLPNNKYLIYRPNYLCACAKDADAHVRKKRARKPSSYMSPLDFLSEIHPYSSLSLPFSNLTPTQPTSSPSLLLPLPTPTPSPPTTLVPSNTI